MMMLPKNIAIAHLHNFHSTVRERWRRGERVEAKEEHTFEFDGANYSRITSIGTFGQTYPKTVLKLGFSLSI